MAGADQQATVYSIPPARGFLDDLAAGLIARYPDPLALARLLVLLPTRRSVLALTEAFVRQSEGAALLLPRIEPVGDIDADEALGNFANDMEEAAEVLPAACTLSRRLALARLLAQRHGRGASDSLLIACQLSRALDQMLSHGKTAAELLETAPDISLQEHWETNRQILALILEAWPSLLAERGRIDPIQRTNLLLGALAARWEVQPPPGGVVLAGLSSAPPAVASLARVVARMKGGVLILPGLDETLSPDDWNEICGAEGETGRETHPMFGLARLLSRIKVKPVEVQRWPYRVSELAACPEERSRRIAVALAPGGPVAQPIERPVELDGVRMVEAANASEEALVLAIALRQVVERPGVTAALVTPDRELARRVAVQLKRFDIIIDDSAGEPMVQTGAGSLLIALAAAAGERFAPVPLLAMLGHPLIRAGTDRGEWLHNVRALDRLALRGLRPAPGLAGVSQRLATLAKRNGELMPLLQWWEQEARPLLEPLPIIAGPADKWLDHLFDVAEALAGEGLWAGQAGRCLSSLVDELEDSRADLARITVRLEDAPGFVAGLMQGVVVRPKWRRHPQIQILGPLEARLQRADLLLLGGLNEGTWPTRPEPDPFLAPAIRRRMNMPGLPERVSLQAHDLLMAMGAPEVLLTRSARSSSAPAVASRFWQGLLAITGEKMPDSGELTPNAETLLQAAKDIDRAPHTQPIARPQPAPPAAHRPRAISVTEVALLKADPFAFYARHMMKLSPLDPLDAEPTGAEKGTIVHRILERWFTDAKAREAGAEALIAEELAKLGERPEIAALWRPRVERMLEFAIQQADEDQGWSVAAAERKGRLDRHGVILTGKADRVDRSADGYRIVDYKTGAVPNVKQMQELWNTQLPLLAAMVESGAFPDIPAGPVVQLQYWKLSGGRSQGKVQPAPSSRADTTAVVAHIEAAMADFDALTGGYLLGERPFIAKYHLIYGGQWRDYDLLARLAEWKGR